MQLQGTQSVLHKMMGCSINETSECLETTEKLYPKRLQKHQICLCSVCFKFGNELKFSLEMKIPAASIAMKLTFFLRVTPNIQVAKFSLCRHKISLVTSPKFPVHVIKVP